MHTEGFFASSANRKLPGETLLIRMAAPAGAREIDTLESRVVELFRPYDAGAYLVENLPSLSHLVGWVHSKSFHDLLRHIADAFPPARAELRRRCVPETENATRPGVALLNAVNS